MKWIFLCTNRQCGRETEVVADTRPWPPRCEECVGRTVFFGVDAEAVMDLPRTAKTGTDTA